MTKVTVIAIIVIIAAIYIILVPVIFYSVYFAKSGFSSNISDWANFSTYWSAFISLANLILFGTLTYFIHSFERSRHAEEMKRQEDNKKREQILDRPVLVFSKQRNENYYDIKNVGKGVAMEPVVKSKYTIDSEEHIDGVNVRSWETQYIIYPLMAGFELSLEKAGKTPSLCAVYKDIFGKKYFTMIENDSNKVFSEDEIEENKMEYGQISRPAKNTVVIK